VNFRNRLGQIVVWGAGVTTLFITPFYSQDPVNVPRFVSILIFGLIGFFLCLSCKNLLLSAPYIQVTVASFLFVVWALISLFVSKMNLTEGLYGVTGRQTGIISFFALILLMISSMISSSHQLLYRLVRTLILVGAVSGFYGILQVFNLDPFDWKNPYSNVIGLFGNPNFQSSFMGISAVAATTFASAKETKPRSRGCLIAYILLALFNIYHSKSLQGFLVFLVGAVIVGYLFVRANIFSKKFEIAYIFAAISMLAAMTLDILQKAPWSSVLYKDSVSFRGDFWRAGWKMTMDHPIFGVGLDGYRDHYKASRDLVTALRPGSDAVTDSAHNILLDISSGGGIPLLIIYIYLLFLTITSAIKVIRRNNKLDITFTAIFATWVAYFAQSLISIGQLGLSIWGWIFMGVIIGFEINTREKTYDFKLQPAYSTVATGLGMIIGLGVGLPLFVADASFRSTVESGNVLKIESAVNQWPQSVTRLVFVAEAFRKGNLPERSIVIAREAVAFNPMNLEAWKELSLQPKASEQERAEALAMIKKLDPFNPNLK
jgi:O-antigen ligase